MSDDDRNPVGRPTEYDHGKIPAVTKLCELGATMDELADFLGVTTVTVWRWRHTHPEFCMAVKVGRDAADDRVERSLYQRATGYTRKALKIMQYEGAVVTHEYDEEITPDVSAAIFWLKNRRPDEWREKVAHEHSGKLTLEELVAQSGLPAK